jgi:16S rRNA (guanine966-N2)-methyltransferase
LGEPFDLVFLDPPYAYNLVPQALDQLVRGAWITREALAVAETSSDEEAPVTPGWKKLDERLYGAARVTFLKQA